MDSSWNATFLEVLITILVFAFGLPALFLQLNIPEEIRDIARRRMKLYWWYSLMGIIMVAALFLIWGVQFWADDLGKSYSGRFSSSITLTVILIMVIVFWHNLLNKYEMSNIIAYLGNDLKKHFKKHHRIEPKALENLTSLGILGKVGKEKEAVLKTFGAFAQQVQGPEQYKGVELEEVIKSITAVVTKKESMGNDQNFTTASAILKGIWNTLRDRDLESTNDAKLTIAAKRDLCVTAIKNGDRASALTILENIRSIQNSPQTSSSLFEIGMAALKTHEYVIAQATLSSLDTYSKSNGKLNDSVGSDLLGLLSYFYTHGESCKRLALSTLNDMQEHLHGKPLKQRLTEAIDYHNLRLNIEASDKLILMSRSLGKNVNGK